MIAVHIVMPVSVLVRVLGSLHKSSPLLMTPRTSIKSKRKTGYERDVCAILCLESETPRCCFVTLAPFNGYSNRS